MMHVKLHMVSFPPSLLVSVSTRRMSALLIVYICNLPVLQEASPHFLAINRVT